jgi:hypothetical protein
MTIMDGELGKELDENPFRDVEVALAGSRLDTGEVLEIGFGGEVRAGERRETGVSDPRRVAED